MKRVLLMTAAGLLLASTAMAGMENCRFALHWKAKFSPTKTIPTKCDNPSTPTEEPNYSPNFENLACRNYATQGPAGSGEVYVVVGKAGTEGVSAVSFGVDYSGSAGAGIDPAFVTFSICADGLSFPNDGGFGEFPRKKGGTRITWNNATSCQFEQIGADGVHAVVGSFYIYAYGPDVLKVTPNNNLQGGTPELAVANCAGITTDLYQQWGPTIVQQIMGQVGVGGPAGFNACLATPTVASTWGNIKTTDNH